MAGRKLSLYGGGVHYRTWQYIPGLGRQMDAEKAFSVNRNLHAHDTIACVTDVMFKLAN